MFDDRLRQLRQERGLTQAQIAKMLNINSRTYASYENNEREPNSEMLLLLSDLYKVSIDYLLGINTVRELRVSTARRKPFEATDDEQKLLQIYRGLTYEGKEYIKTTLKMCQQYYKDGRIVDEYNDTVFLENQTKNTQDIIKEHKSINVKV